MAKIITFGEIMLRLSTVNNRFTECTNFDVNYGGGEANVAISLAHYGHDAYFVTKLPKNDIAESAIKSLRAENVKCDYISRGGDRLGIYYLETGSSLRASKVIYDRMNSSFSNSDIDDFDFEEIFKNAAVFHFSGITPALSEKCAQIVEKACKTAKKMGIIVSCDLNYRKKLWSKEQAQKVMKNLMQYVDICIGNEEDAESCLGYKPKSNVLNAVTPVEGYKETFRQMAADYHFKIVASTLRESYSASHNGWKALLFDGQSFYESKHYDINPIVDRVGAGDSFSAGLIHGLLSFDNLQKALEFAVAASALKHTIKGDFNQVSEEEVFGVMDGNISGRVSR